MPKDEKVWKAPHPVIDRIADDRRSASALIVSIASTKEAIEIAVRSFSRRVRMDHPRFGRPAPCAH